MIESLGSIGFGVQDFRVLGISGSGSRLRMI